MPISQGLALHFSKQNLLKMLPLAMRSRGVTGMVWREAAQSSDHAMYFMESLRLAR